MTFRSWRSHMTKQSYPGSLPYFPERPFPDPTPTSLLSHPDGNLTQWSFYRVQEHMNRSSDEEVMTFRSWRSHMTKQSYPGSLPYLPERPFSAALTLTSLLRNPDGNLTQWDFHRVQEHPNRSSDEEVMTFRSWRSCRILAGRNPSGVNPAGVTQPGDPAG